MYSVTKWNRLISFEKKCYEDINYLNNNLKDRHNIEFVER